MMELVRLIYRPDLLSLSSNLNALLLMQAGKDGKGEPIPAAMPTVEEADEIKRKEKRKQEREV